jgi:hypothetical protein
MHTMSDQAWLLRTSARLREKQQFVRTSKKFASLP